MLRSASDRVLAATLLAVSVPCQSSDFGWEPIADDFRNVRGLNYVSVYPSREGAPDYYGVASPTAMWWEYDAHPLAVPLTAGAQPQGTAGEVYEQLGWVKKLGCNSIRVWLSYSVWEQFEATGTGPVNEYVHRLQHFAWLCEKHRLRVIPVLWDGYGFGDPDPIDPIAVANRSAWLRSPGTPQIAQFVTQDPTLVATNAGDYVLDMITAFRNSPAFLCWDVMNEPETIGGFSVEQETFIVSTLGILKQHAPEMDTHIAMLWAEDKWPAVGRIARDPNLDSLGMHPYGHTRANIEAALWDATHLDDGQGGVLQKPVFVTEIGAPGWALSYQDSLRYVAGVPRPEIGRGERGIGFLIWGAMVGWEDGNFLFKEMGGIFHGDGRVREVDVAHRFLQLAKAQGISGSELFRRDEVVQWAGPGGVEQDLSIHVDDWDFLALRAWQTVAEYGAFSFDEFTDTCRVFRSVAYYFAVGAISSATNPINDPAIWGNVVDPQDLAVALWSAEWLCSGPSDDPIPPELRSALSGFVGEPFVPETNSAHLQLLTTIFLDDFRHALLPYLVARGGPY